MDNYTGGYRKRRKNDLTDKYYRLGYIAANIAKSKQDLDLEKTNFNNMLQNTLIQLTMLQLMQAQRQQQPPFMGGGAMPAGMMQPAGGMNQPPETIAGMPTSDTQSSGMPSSMPNAPHRQLTDMILGGNIPPNTEQSPNVSEPLMPSVLQGYAL